MKILFLVGAVIVVAVSSGCAGPRTASIGYKNSAPILTTNMVGTVTASGTEGQPRALTTITNWSVISTPPVPNRTWREMALGQRPPGAAAPLFIPPFPGEGGIMSAPPQRVFSTGRLGSYRGSARSYSGSLDLSSGRSGLGQPNPRANLQRSIGSRTSLGQSNPRAGLQRSIGSRTALGRTNPRANH